ncbi:MAG: YhdH/YhfP family quinone oxidoreductase, partial [Flavobacteriales bacterium]
PGVDAAGVVVEDKTGRYAAGDEVICTSYDLGMNTKGGFAEYISVPSDWLVKMPEGMSAETSMVLGTAAYTAGLALYKMEMCGQEPSMGPIVVTGATGGVGSMAVSLLSKAGYEVWASTGKGDAQSYLKGLGASKIIGRDEVNDSSSRPIFKSEWAGAIDNVGGQTLTTLLRKCGRNGSVATIGLVDKAEFDMTIYPFILNGVNLLGIDSAETPRKLRELVWQNISSKWLPEFSLESYKIVDLEEIPALMDAMLQGKTKGRILAKMV